MTPIAVPLVLAALFSAAGIVPNGPAVVDARPPDYPEAAIKARMTGQAVVDVTIDEDGCVTATDSQGVNPLLAGAARRAASGWRFVPDAGAGDRCATLMFEFVLNDSDSTEVLPLIESRSPHSLVVAAVELPVQAFTIWCNLDNYERFVDADPWSTRFSAKLLAIYPGR